MIYTPEYTRPRQANAQTPPNAAKYTNIFIPHPLLTANHHALPALLFVLAFGAVAGWTGASGIATSEKSS